MEKPYFVMLNNQRRTRLVPFADGEELAMFSTEREAMDAAEGNLMAINFGYEIFKVGEGVLHAH
jgi:hypothetical protein